MGHPSVISVAGILQQAPVEDEATYEAANPAKDGKVVFDEKANEVRENAIVRSLLRAAYGCSCSVRCS